jgi:hypothetical protein
MKKQCLECETEFTGRVDKKFCSDYCRNAFNNKLRQDSTNTVRNINNTLRKNRRILEELAPNGKAKSTKEEMLKRGFHFEYFTNILNTQTGNTYNFCYDYGYLEIGKGFYAIVKKLEQ